MESFPTISSLEKIKIKDAIEVKNYLFSELQKLLNTLLHLTALREHYTVTEKTIHMGRDITRPWNMISCKFKLEGDINQTLRELNFSLSIDTNGKELLKREIEENLQILINKKREKEIDSVQDYKLWKRNQQYQASLSYLRQFKPFEIHFSLIQINFSPFVSLFVKKIITSLLKFLIASGVRILNRNLVKYDMDIFLRYVLLSIFEEEVSREFLNHFHDFFFPGVKTNFSNSLLLFIESQTKNKEIRKKLQDNNAIYFYETLVNYLIYKIYEDSLPQNEIERKLIDQIGEKEFYSILHLSFYEKLIAKIIPRDWYEQ